MFSFYRIQPIYNASIIGTSGNDFFLGTSYQNDYYGYGGNDTVSYVKSNAGVTVNLSSGDGSGGHAENDNYIAIEDVTGSYFDDILVGDGGRNVLNGLNGDDIIYGFGGSDIIYGGNGDDTIYGGENYLNSWETLDGGNGDDEIFGGGGHDKIYGGAGNNDLFGEAGNDQFHLGEGNNTVDGGAGANSLNYTKAKTGVNIDVENGSVTVGNFTDQFTNIGTIKGSYHDDSFWGGDDDDYFIGSNGEDVLVGNDGNDTLRGSANTYGDNDRDEFVFANNEGAGADFSHGNDIIQDFEVGIDKIDLSGTEIGERADGNDAQEEGWDDLLNGGDRYMEQSGNDTIIYTIDGQNGDSITLQNTDMNTLSADDFIF